jgi:putative flippase GtrA
VYHLDRYETVATPGSESGVPLPGTLRSIPVTLAELVGVKNYIASFTNRKAGTQMMRLALIGMINTGSYFVLFNVLRTVGLSLFWSVTAAFGTVTLLSYVLNRRWTFELTRSTGSVRETLAFFLTNVVAWAVTILIVGGADRWFGPIGRIGENVAAVVAAVVILVPRFASYRDIVFRKALREQAPNTLGTMGAEANWPT